MSGVAASTDQRSRTATQGRRAKISLKAAPRAFATFAPVTVARAGRCGCGMTGRDRKVLVYQLVDERGPSQLTSCNTINHTEDRGLHRPRRVSGNSRSGNAAVYFFPRTTWESSIVADQLRLSEEQNRLMAALTDAWEEAKADRLGATTCLVAAEKARDALQKGGTWPDTFWVENILMIGANCCAKAVLNDGLYLPYKEIMETLYGEVLERRWIKGGPTLFFDEREATGLSRAVGQWAAQ